MDDEHRDANARDKGKAREMPQDVYDGNREVTEHLYSQSPSNGDPQ